MSDTRIQKSDRDPDRDPDLVAWKMINAAADILIGLGVALLFPNERKLLGGYWATSAIARKAFQGALRNGVPIWDALYPAFGACTAAARKLSKKEPSDKRAEGPLAGHILLSLGVVIREDNTLEGRRGFRRRIAWCSVAGIWLRNSPLYAHLPDWATTPALVVAGLIAASLAEASD